MLKRKRTPKPHRLFKGERELTMREIFGMKNKKAEALRKLASKIGEHNFFELKKAGLSAKQIFELVQAIGIENFSVSLLHYNFYPNQISQLVKELKIKNVAKFFKGLKGSIDAPANFARVLTIGELINFIQATHDATIAGEFFSEMSKGHGEKITMFVRAIGGGTNAGVTLSSLGLTSVIDDLKNCSNSKEIIEFGKACKNELRLN